jgi:response regulator of citrate/malate metabolism
MKVLIIEDDMILSLSLEIMMKRLGFTEIQKTHNGEKALDVLVEFEPDLMLVDIFLGPGISGIDVVKEIQKQKEIPVIYITGNSDDYHKNMASETTYLDYLVKPITFTDLKRVLENNEVITAEAQN